MPDNRLKNLFIQAKEPTPIYNCCDLARIYGGEDGHLLFDQQGLFRPLEMIAFEGTPFQIIAKNGEVFEVTTPCYPSCKPLFIHASFLQETPEPKMDKKHPEKEEVIEKMLSQIGVPYLWGGNYPEGISKLLTLFHPPIELGEYEKNAWQLKGLDCSGLLYWATSGFTERNCSQLLNFGEQVLRENWRPRALDLVVWKDHVVILINSHQVIQAKEKFGVYISPLEANLKGEFVIRRWFFL
ncbi:MAG: NlpC/P60 family protein [Simkaniaceae bacterium]|nr:NlpC/P60 family protein [Simkaniaceae bacterium]